MNEPEWLSDVVTPNLGTTRSSKSELSGLTTEQIEVQPLDSSTAAPMGVLPPDQSGIPTDIWGDSDADTIARLITPHLPSALPAVTAFWQRLALAETLPPAGAGGPGEVLRARVDHLLNAGALDQAEALLQIASPLTPPLFQRAFDVGLLTERADNACRIMRNEPNLSPGIKARIFCLARSGDWAAAALTLRTAETLGQVSGEEAALMSRYLDPELFEDEPEPPPARTLSALDFTMREILALPRARGTLPLAFLHVDLDNTTPWRARVLATERLVRSQALAPRRLLELYQEGRPAASGGVWVRVDAVQKLLKAMDQGDPAIVSEALITAYRALSEAKLGFALAPLAAEELRDVPLDGRADRLRFDLWLMAPGYAELVWDHQPGSPQEELLQAVALSRFNNATPHSDLAAAVIAGLTRSEQRGTLIWAVDDNRRGEAILKALATLVRTRHADPVALEIALVVLRRSGLKDEARRIALQALLAEEGRL
ncbi:MAG: hypothetical protein AAF393_02235 [Pseudomonadota bacterium]